MLAAASSGCSYLRDARDWDQTTVKPEVLPASGRAVAQGFADLAQAQKDLRDRLEKQVAVPPPVPLAPSENRLDTTVINVSMRDAKVSSVLWLIAGELGFNLVMDAGVAAMPTTSSLHLVGMTGRDALRRVTEAFDVHARFTDDNVLRVGMLEDKVFELEFSVAGKQELTVSSGGDVLGSGSDESTIRDNLLFNGKLGDDTDDLLQFHNVLSSIVLGTGNDVSAVDKKDASHKGGEPRFSIDRSRGLLFVSARPSQMAQVQKVIDQSREYNRRQVRLDMQLLDVSLTDDFQFGIDWSALGTQVAAQVAGVPATLGAVTVPLANGIMPVNRAIGFPVSTIGTANGGGGLLLRGGDVTAAINALRRFGNVQLLSSPTVRLKNGGHAFMSVGTSQRYVRQVVTRVTATTTGQTTSTDVATDSVFSGVVIGVAANVRSDGRIELFLRPSQSATSADSLRLQPVSEAISVSLPVTEGKTLSTTLEVADGDTVILGGLIDVGASGLDRGLPGLAEHEGTAGLFGQTRKSNSAREMVMVAKVTRL